MNQNLDYISQLKNKDILDARQFDWFRVNGNGASGNLSTTGAKTIALDDMPYGLAIGGSVYISGGIGTPESADIIGITGNGEDPTGTITVALVNVHSGSWRVGSATVGIQEAIYELPNTGGIVVVPSGGELFNDVHSANKSNVIVNRVGPPLTGAFKILGAFDSVKTQNKIFQTPPNFATINTLFNGTQFDIGGFPDGRQMNFTTGPATQALVGAVNVESGALNTAISMGVSGYARATVQSHDVVGIFGCGVNAGPNTQSWGANFVVGHDTGNIAGSLLVGVEIDTNHSASGGDAAATMIGLSVVANHPTPLIGLTSGITVQKTAVSHPYTVALNIMNGAATLGISVGTTHETNNNVNSQAVQFIARNASGTTLVSSMFLDVNDIFWIKASSAGSGIVAIDPGGAGASAFNFRTDFNQSNLPLRLLPITAAQLPAGPLEGMIAVITDATSNVWGTPITGGGSFKVAVYFNGTAWTVFAK